MLDIFILSHFRFSVANLYTNAFTLNLQKRCFTESMSAKPLQLHSVFKSRIKENISTVNFLNFRTPENFAVKYLKFKQRGQRLGNLKK